MTIYWFGELTNALDMHTAHTHASSAIADGERQSVNDRKSRNGNTRVGEAINFIGVTIRLFAIRANRRQMCSRHGHSRRRHCNRLCC